MGSRQTRNRASAAVLRDQVRTGSERSKELLLEAISLEALSSPVARGGKAMAAFLEEVRLHPHDHCPELWERWEAGPPYAGKPKCKVHNASSHELTVNGEWFLGAPECKVESCRLSGGSAGVLAGGPVVFGPYTVNPPKCPSPGDKYVYRFEPLDPERDLRIAVMIAGVGDLRQGETYSHGTDRREVWSFGAEALRRYEGAVWPDTTPQRTWARMAWEALPRCQRALVERVDVADDPSLLGYELSVRVEAGTPASEQAYVRGLVDRELARLREATPITWRRASRVKVSAGAEPPSALAVLEASHERQAKQAAPESVTVQGSCDGCTSDLGDFAKAVEALGHMDVNGKVVLDHSREELEALRREPMVTGDPLHLALAFCSSGYDASLPGMVRRVKVVDRGASWHVELSVWCRAQRDAHRLAWDAVAAYERAWKPGKHVGSIRVTF